MGRKLGAVPFFRGESWVPSNTMWPGPRPTCMQSFILIHPTIWPQQAYTNVTDRTEQDRQTTVYSTGRTVLQTVVCENAFLENFQGL